MCVIKCGSYTNEVIEIYKIFIYYIQKVEDTLSTNLMKIRIFIFINTFALNYALFINSKWIS